jgi:hypothetical protein
MVTEDTVEEEKIPKKSKAKKSPYDFTESDVDNITNMRVHIVRVKETDADGSRAWKEYKVAATGAKAALKLIGHNNYDPVNMADGGSYEEE